MNVLSFPVFLWMSASGWRRPAACVASGVPSAFVVVDRRSDTDTIATVTVCLMSDAGHALHLRVGGYHGELTMQRASQIMRVTRPAGGTRIENTTVAGHLSFAGVAVNGISSGWVLAFDVLGLPPGSDAEIRLSIADVTDIEGRDLTAKVRVDALARVTRTP